MEELIDEIKNELEAEVISSDDECNEILMLSKIKNAIREVKRARKYPSYYTDEQIEADIGNYYSNIRDIALYDYNQAGIENQSGSTENGTTRTYVDRNTLFAGIVPLSVV
jgi:hypothetical protein